MLFSVALRARLGASGTYRLVKRAVLIGVGAPVLGLVTTAMAADDDGSRTFFREQIDRAQSQAVPAQPATEVSASPAVAPLTVRRSRAMQDTRQSPEPSGHRFSVSSGHRLGRRPQSSPSPASAPVLTAERPLTIARRKRTSVFVDSTLKRGDIVILADGPRVFAGSSNFPYVEKDFVAYEQAPGMGKDLKAQLKAIATNPRQGH